MAERRTWVQIEVNKGTGETSTFRGTLAADEFDDLVSGDFHGDFLRLEHTHWDHTVWNPQTERYETKYTIVGENNEWRDLTGTYFIPVGIVVSVATLRDCSELFVDGAERSRH